MKEEEIPDDSGSLNHFRSSLSQFSFASSDNNQPRRSPRKQSLPASRSPAKRPSNSQDIGSPSRERSIKKQKRSYAPPETYAHLRELQDHLKQDLDVIFCGINPGKKSAEMGHHFGNPSNHFWWCLHHSGFTDTQLPPQEDSNLPDRFSLGLTNLVDRPTSEQTELSKKEQLASVPFFLAKIARYRPRIVCFVGLSIAKVVESSLNVTLSDSTKSWGLRPYKMVHPSSSTFADTLFFAAPSTSGLVTHFQRPQKARIFGELRQMVEDLKAGRMTTVGMTVIRPEQIAQSPDPFPASSHTLLNLTQPTKVEEKGDGTGNHNSAQS
ncbi:uracil-DNA glycosylase-like protein [Mycena maculata]|uniref:Uracil-DNA glycosylase-like protein n=1 Tax=Mycena maculata TaxID=230809 RepID=A0AAD7IGZ4_9AGAR|nr:uracil-DNA glycosylase-like protein [Mycena maculata]